jgi:hypothetical protein|tara:strand:- start:632 stop:820 length:189 start_codon:yes stop_codon:yes gene_type:complete
MHRYSAHQRVFQLLVIALNLQAVKVVPISEFGFNPVYRMINFFISWKLDSNLFKEFKKPEIA